MFTKLVLADIYSPFKALNWKDIGHNVAVAVLASGAVGTVLGALGESLSTVLPAVIATGIVSSIKDGIRQYFGTPVA